ncbi:MAG: hypothetical protein QXR98_02480 [Fervidicoccaceae archaeon]
MNEENDICLIIATSVLGLELGKKFAKEIQEKLSGMKDEIKFIGVISKKEEIPQSCSSSIVLVATGGTEDVIVNIGNMSKNLHLFYHDSFNSLPATLESVAFLRQMGKEPHLHKYDGPDSLLRMVDALERAKRGIEKLKSCRLGVVGGVSDWLVYSRVNPSDVKRKLGSEIVEIPLQELLELMDNIDAQQDMNEITKKARKIEVSREEISKALRVHGALLEIAKKYNLCGLTVKCFDLILAKRTTACLSMSLMNTKVFPAACEGDVPLLISMALGEFVTERPAFMGNPAILKKGEILIAHCTAPLISSFKLTTHFESNLGVGISVDYPYGEAVTIYRIDSGLEKIRIGKGRIKEWKWREDLCRTQVLIELENAEKILKKSIGNHYALIIGDWVEELSAAGELLGLNVETI